MDYMHAMGSRSFRTGSELFDIYRKPEILDGFIENYTINPDQTDRIYTREEGKPS